MAKQTDHANHGSEARRHGFAALDEETRREIARRGGKAAHAQHRAHVFTPEEARAAGRKGGATVSRDRQHMADIGRIGGMSRGKRNKDHEEEKREPSSEETRDTIPAPPSVRPSIPDLSS